MHGADRDANNSSSFSKQTTILHVVQVKQREEPNLQTQFSRKKGFFREPPIPLYLATHLSLLSHPSPLKPPIPLKSTHMKGRGEAISQRAHNILTDFILSSPHSLPLSSP